MASKFRRGAMAYDKHGRAYVVEDVESGTVYCAAENGVETEFPEAALVTEAEWQARHTRTTDDKQRPIGDRLYERVKSSRVYMAPTAKLDPTASLEVLAKVERLLPGIRNFAALVVAERALDADGDAGQSDLSLVKCREVFDAAKPEIQASLVAGLFGSPPEVFIGAGRLGDNLMRALIAKFLETYGPEFTAFRGGRRR
jgi:hypothetical protein